MSGPAQASDDVSTEPLRYNFEYARRIRAGFIGCGGHAFRNVYTGAALHLGTSL